MLWRSEFKYEKKKKIIRKQFKRHQNQQGHFGRCGGSQQHPCTDLPGFTVGGAALKRAAALESAPRTAPAAAAAAAKSLQSYPTLCDPIRRQPTRLPHPWDSPSKNTGVGCHFLLQCVKVKSESEVVSDS